MDHVDDGTLQAYADGELPLPDRVAAERHLSECGECSSALSHLTSVSRLFSAAVAQVDRPAPVELAYAGISRSRAPRLRDRSWRVAARAAALILGVATAAYAAVPGSPIRAWLEEALGVVRQPERVATAPTAPPVALPDEGAMAAGVSVLPADGIVRVVLVDAPAGLRIRARISDGERAEVFASGEAATARFQTGVGRIEVLQPGPGEVTIALPLAATEATVTVNGRLYLYKEGDQLRLAAGGGRPERTEVLLELE